MEYIIEEGIHCPPFFLLLLIVIESAWVDSTFDINKKKFSEYVDSFLGTHRTANAHNEHKVHLVRHVK